MEIGFLILSVLVGTAIAHFGKASPKQAWFKWVLAFSGAYLFGITITHIIPEAFSTGDLTVTAASILIGFLLQYLLDFITGGVEHGHIHHHDNKIPYALLFGLFMHAFIESIPVSLEHHHSHGHGNLLLWAIVIHKVPISLVLYVLMKKSVNSSSVVYLTMLLFSLCGPIGYWLGDNLSFFIDNSAILLGLTGGIFLHVSTTIIFESDQHHKLNFQKMIAVLIGFVLAFLGVLA